MQKTEKIILDVDLIPEELYQQLVQAFKETRNDVVYVNDIKVEAIVEYNE